MGNPESKPWREISLLPSREAWTLVVEEALRDTCLMGPVDWRNFGTNKMKILMFGPTQNGKSSLVNSLLCAMTSVINQYVLASLSERSVTRALHSPDVRVNKRTLNFKLTDMPGFFRGMGRYAEDYLTAVLGGHIREGAIVPEGPLDETADYYVQNPEPFDPPCCVVLVMRAGRPLDDDAKDKFRLVVDAAERIKLKVAVVLTHVDNLAGARGAAITGRNVSRIFCEEAVHQAVQQASNDTGIQPCFIFPVVNYTHQVETITEMNILHLYTLSKILEMAGEGVNARFR